MLLLSVMVVCGLFFALWLAWPSPPPRYHVSRENYSTTAQQEREQR